MLIQEVALVAFALALPLIVQLRGGPISWMFASVTLCYLALLFGTGIFWNVKVFSQSIGFGRAYHATYNEALSIDGAASYTFPLPFLAVTTWLQEKFRAMLYPRLTVGLFWLLNLAVLALFIGPVRLSGWFAPPRYLDDAEIFQTLGFVINVLTVFWLVSCVGLLGTLIWSSVARLRER